MKSNRGQRVTQILFILIMMVAVFGMWHSRAQEKPKDSAIKSATIDIPFSPSDAVEINKWRIAREDADRKIAEILTSYGGEGQVLLDGHGNYVGIRKIEQKKP